MKLPRRFREASDGTTSAGDTIDVHFPGRRGDCAANDLSVGVLVTFGDFRYLVAGDLTGDVNEDVANIEDAIAPSIVSDVDVYHVSHHGAQTSSIPSFVAALNPTVTIVSNGTVHGRPRDEVINNRILASVPETALYLTNRNTQHNAWDDDLDAIADLDASGFDGLIEMHVWTRSYRVFKRRGMRGS